MAFIYAWYSTGVWHEGRGRNLLDGAAPFYRCYDCSDGRAVAVGAIEPQFFDALMDGLGLAGEGWDQGDRAGWPKLAARVAEVFRTRPRDDWAKHFEGSDACVTPVLTLSEAPTHPHNRARGTFIGSPDQPAPGPRFSSHPPSIRDCPTTPDALRETVLAEWGI